MSQLTKLQKRFLYFLIGCIPTRIGLGYLVKYSETHIYLQLLIGIIISIISIGFLSIYLFGLRKTGAETQGQPIWWNRLRPLHSILYGIVGVLLLSQFIGIKLPNILYINKFTLGRNIIIGDTIFGLVSFIIYHYYNGNLYNFIR